jgi:hypothetical protein
MIIKKLKKSNRGKLSMVWLPASVLSEPRGIGGQCNRQRYKSYVRNNITLKDEGYTGINRRENMRDGDENNNLGIFI